MTFWGINLRNLPPAWRIVILSTLLHSTKCLNLNFGFSHGLKTAGIDSPCWHSVLRSCVPQLMLGPSRYSSPCACLPSPHPNFVVHAWSASHKWMCRFIFLWENFFDIGPFLAVHRYHSWLSTQEWVLEIKLNWAMCKASAWIPLYYHLVPYCREHSSSIWPCVYFPVLSSEILKEENVL